MHTSLHPKTNMKLLALWSIAAGAAAFVPPPSPWLLLGAGVALGACAGIIQLHALREASTALLTTETAMDVRRVLSSTRFGRLYLYVFWGSVVVLFALASRLFPGLEFFGILAGYSAFAFARELLTLRGTLSYAGFRSSSESDHFGCSG